MVYIYIYIYMHTPISLSIYIYICAYIHTYTHIYIYIYIYIYAYIHIHTYIYIYIHTCREKERRLRASPTSTSASPPAFRRAPSRRSSQTFSRGGVHGCSPRCLHLLVFHCCSTLSRGMTTVRDHGFSRFEKENMFWLDWRENPRSLKSVEGFLTDKEASIPAPKPYSSSFHSCLFECFQVPVPVILVTVRYRGRCRRTVRQRPR